MPFHIATSRSAGSPSTVVDLLDINHHQLVSCVRRLAEISSQAHSIFGHIQSELVTFNERTERLSEKALTLDAKVNNLRDPRTQKIKGIKALRRYQSVTEHYRFCAAATSSADPMALPANVCTKANRSDVVCLTYARLQPIAPQVDYFEKLMAIDDKATQTDKSALSIYQNDSTNDIPGETMAVDACGSTLRRATDCQPHYATINKRYKNKVVTVPITNGVAKSNNISTSFLPQNDQPHTKAATHQSGEPIYETRPPSCATCSPPSPEYDVADYFTKARSIHSSLRRPKPLQPSRQDASEPNDTHRTSSATESRRIRAVIKRTLSFRRVRAPPPITEEHVDGKENNVYLTTATMHRRNKSVDQLQSQMRRRRKFSLPISTNSQVMNVASSLMIKAQIPDDNLGYDGKDDQSPSREDSAGSSSAYGSNPSSQNRPISVSSTLSIEFKDASRPHTSCHQSGFETDSGNHVETVPATNSANHDIDRTSPSQSAPFTTRLDGHRHHCHTNDSDGPPLSNGVNSLPRRLSTVTASSKKASAENHRNTSLGDENHHNVSSALDNHCIVSPGVNHYSVSPGVDQQCNLSSGVDNHCNVSSTDKPPTMDNRQLPPATIYEQRRPHDDSSAGKETDLDRYLLERFEKELKIRTEVVSVRNNNLE